MKTKIVIFLMIIVLMLGLSVSFAESAPEIYLNDVEVLIKSALGNPFINENGITMVPLEGFMSYFGTEIEYVSDSENVVIYKGENRLEFVSGESYFNKNGFKILLETNTVNGDQDLFVPLRRVMEVMGCNVTWDEGKRAIQIDSSQESVAMIRAELMPFENLMAKGDIIENRLEFAWPEISEVDYYLLYIMNDSWNPIRVSAPIFSRDSSYYRPGYFDVTRFEGRPAIYFKVSSVVEGVESELSEVISIDLK